MNMKYLWIVSLVVCVACNKEYTPKPSAQLRLEYPEPDYERSEVDLPFTFDKNLLAEKTRIRPLQGASVSYGIDLEYKALKGTIYLTYKAIDNSDELLIKYLRDAQNFTQKHTQKADEITETPYENSERRVYGMFYEVGGNAASQSQFYVTDSVNHFLTGSLYFYTRPNFDSILPAANYLQTDIRRLMESIQWK